MTSVVFNEQALYAGRTEEFAFALYDYLEAPLVIQVSDVVRFKLALTEGAVPVLDIDSVGFTTAGSKVVISTLGVGGTTPAGGLIRIAQADTAALAPGRYFAELSLVDDSETNPDNAIKVCGRGTMVVKASPLGDIGLT